MWIAAGTLLFALTVLLHITDSICSEPRTLEDLFPGYKGIMPPVVELPYEHQFRNFETFGNRRMKERSITLVKRDHIIFGWRMSGGEISDPCYLFPPSRNTFIAFDMNEERWITLPKDLSRKMGANRIFDFVVARDEVAATHVTTSNNPLYKDAHIRACKEANDRADIVEGEREELLLDRKTTRRESIRIIKEEYSQAYNRAFMLRLHPHGENDIHGYRERQP